MKTSKVFSSAQTFGVSNHLPMDRYERASDLHAPLRIALPENPTNKRTIDLSAWLGRGIDDWVYATAAQLRASLMSKAIETATVVSYWKCGMEHFLCFIQGHGPKKPDQLMPTHINSFINWLLLKNCAYVSKKNMYSGTKSVLIAMIRSGVVANHDEMFPANPFPKYNSTTKGQSPLSQGERTRLIQALRDDIIAIHRGEFKGTSSNALVVYLLGIAIRCGVNTSPLLEAKRSCLMPHPFIPNMRRLTLLKRRGNATMIANLRFSREDEAGASITMDGVALFEKALALSAPCVDKAMPEQRNMLWLYESEGFANAGQISCLDTSTLTYGIKALVARHDLRGDDERPLAVNLSRLRKTVEERLFNISGGDLIGTAALMGHTPQVADNHYLACTQSMREDATFVGEVLPHMHRSGQAGVQMIPIAPLPGPTPTGRCKDPWDGDKAPKDGGPCSEFLRCFECSSYAITADPDDLHRFFQTYYFIAFEAEHTQSDEWRAQYRNTMNLMDRFSLDNFGPEAVAEGKARAKAQPSKFWLSYSLPLGFGHT